MTKEIRKFPSIEQFRNVVKFVKMHARYAGKDESGSPIYDPTKPIPTLEFIGSVKLHGTNAAVCQSNGERWLQSREQIITDGHYGFVDWVNQNSGLFDSAFSSIQGHETVCIYGEWCGQGIGEGIVWICPTKGWETSQCWFKVKGEKHSVTKVRTLAEVDIEKVNSIRECVEKIVTENRMLQGLKHLEEMKLDLDIKNMGAFLKWLASDSIREEADTISASGLEPKDIGKAISVKGREWFLQQLNKDIAA